MSKKNHKLDFPNWPSFHSDTYEDIVRPLKSGKVNYWTGDKGREFEQSFAHLVESEYGISCSSGTSALHTIVSALEIGPGDEVIVPSYSFIATAFAVLQAGAIPVFCDVTMDHTIDPNRIEALVNRRTKAIIVVHLYGVVCDMDPIREIAQRYDLRVIEDAAQCLGGIYKGRKVGTLGDAAAFSFCQSKHFTTGGEGGMVTTNDTSLAWECRSFRDHGFDTQQKLDLLDMELKENYIHNRVGFNYRMTEIQSIIGINEVRRFNEWNLKNRHRHAAIYDEILSASPHILKLPLNDTCRRNAYWIYPVVLSECFSLDDTNRLYQQLTQQGVPFTKVLWPEAYLEKAFRQHVGFGKVNFPFNSAEYTCSESVNYDEKICPVARLLSQRTVCLMLHPNWNQEHIEHCAKALMDTLTSLMPMADY
ncbi:DegT/DnrJ/EryC1/StrS family aminotransferase [Aliikangiella coralliicola]|uniref:DegT/DnrJ/EryC1/StrS family aminotransferase n=1 Tax=Aliikangiella coralliicola TaxID=2592383 RepID=A0A545UCX7_9GAMM|nr:DegT/DnrJ/EryC1/StrS family aminotransferase [Aliikangiella coralliicola]TQV87324.1 DegT/DnrJ/EryC1/StrS family aminotransferase [Aliikangiella coralliicola]